jgi:GntR family transcriptional regulator
VFDNDLPVTTQSRGLHRSDRGPHCQSQIRDVGPPTRTNSHGRVDCVSSIDSCQDTTIISVMSVGRSAVTQDSSKVMTLSSVDRGNPTYLHEQVAAEIRRAISDGEAKPGERIPQAKDLAAVLGVNTNTVLRALRVLRDEGLLEVGRGRAITVAGTPERGAVVAKMKEILEFGRHLGYQRDELVAILESLPS